MLPALAKKKSIEEMKKTHIVTEISQIFFSNSIIRTLTYPSRLIERKVQGYKGRGRLDDGSGGTNGDGSRGEGRRVTGRNEFDIL